MPAAIEEHLTQAQRREARERIKEKEAEKARKLATNIAKVTKQESAEHPIQRASDQNSKEEEAGIGT